LSDTEFPQQRHLAGISLRLGAATSFAFMAAMIKVASNSGVHPVEMLFWRFALALVPMTIWALAGPGIEAVKTRRPFAHIWRAAIGFVGMGFGYWSLTLLPLAEATAISFAAPLFATILSALFLSEAVGWHRWGAVLAGFTGVLLVMQPQNASLPIDGLVIALISAFGVACVMITIRQISKTERAFTTVYWFTAISALVLAGVFPFFAVSHSPAAWLAIVAIAGLGGTAQLLLTASLRLAPVGVVAPFDYSQLVWAILLGWLLWTDVPSTTTWIGAAIIIASGIFMLFRERRGMRLARPVIS
jgi:drug/metabolite transporter (DMT)-like permease